MLRLNCKLSVATLLSAALWGGTPLGNGEEPSEYQVKAAFLLNFARFVEWPSTGAAQDPLVIGIVGKNPFGDSLDRAVNGKSANGRSLIIRHLSDLSGLQSCNLVFFPAAENRRFPQAAAALANSSILTVGESDGFAARGGMINFVVRDGRVLFEVNPAAASRARLKISSKVLQLAIVVKDGAQGK